MSADITSRRLDLARLDFDSADFFGCFGTRTGDVMTVQLPTRTWIEMGRPLSLLITATPDSDPT